MASEGRRRAGALVWWLVAILAVVHWDFWFWSDRSLVLGFLPIGLAYQAAYSLAATLLWAAAVRFAWPAELEAWADGEDAGVRRERSA